MGFNLVSKMFGQQQSKKSPQQSPNAIKSEFSVSLVGKQSKKKHWSSAGFVSPRSKCKSTGIQSGPEPCWGSSTEVQYRKEFSCGLSHRFQSSSITEIADHGVLRVTQVLYVAFAAADQPQMQPPLLGTLLGPPTGCRACIAGQISEGQ